MVISTWLSLNHYHHHSWFFFLFFVYYLTQGLQDQMIAWVKRLSESETVNQNIRQERNGEATLICGQQNVRASTRDHRGQNTKDTPKPNIEIEQGMEPGPPSWKAVTVPTTARRRVLFMIETCRARVRSCVSKG